MESQIYWVEGFTQGRLGTMARPRGGDWLEDEIASWKRAGVNVVASALSDDEMHELDIVAEGTLCEKSDIRFMRFPVTDRGLPASRDDWGEFIHSLKALMDDRLTVVTHCRMGIGRATMIAVSLMVAYGVDVNEAFSMVGVARGVPVPDTEEQRDWVVQFGEAIRE